MAIKNEWSLMSFARENGKMSVGDFVSSKTGEEFQACIFTHPTKKTEEGKPVRTFVAFSSKMGPLTPEVIARDKNVLQVVQLESGNYSLCKIGDKSWKPVDLGIDFE